MRPIPDAYRFDSLAEDLIAIAKVSAAGRSTWSATRSAGLIARAAVLAQPAAGRRSC
jgi:hypothetical protein